jgi:autotransporter-associated beta strand protein
VVAQLIGINTMPRMAGTLTSATPATLTTSSNASQTFSGSITGPLSLLKQGAGTLVLNGSNMYTGSTVVAGGGITIKDGATLTSTSSWTVRYGTLTLDNTGLAAAPLGAPLGAGSLFLQGANFTFKAMQGNDATAVGTLRIGTGASIVTNAPMPMGGSSVLTFSALTRDASSYGTLNFQPGSGVLGAPIVGVPGANSVTSGSNPQIIFSTPPPMSNGIIGAWATVNNSDWAVYSGTQNAVSGAFGIGALGWSDTAGKQPFGAYSVGALSMFTDSLNWTGSTQSNGAVRVNTLQNNTGGWLPYSMAGADKVLTILGGGILAGQSSGSGGVTFTGGQVTAGSLGGGTLYFHSYNSGAGLYAALTDNPYGPMSFVKAGANNLSMGVGMYALGPVATTNQRQVTLQTGLPTPVTAGLVPGMVVAVTANGLAAGQFLTGVTSGTAFTLAGTVGTIGNLSSNPNANIFTYPTAQVLQNISFTTGGTQITVPSGVNIWPGASIVYATAGGTLPSVPAPDDKLAKQKGRVATEGGGDSGARRAKAR